MLAQMMILKYWRIN